MHKTSKASHEDKCSNCGSTKSSDFWDYKDGTTLCNKCENKLNSVLKEEYNPHQAVVSKNDFDEGNLGELDKLWGKESLMIVEEANQLSQKGDEKSALELYNKVLKNNPGHIPALVSKADSLNKLKLYKESLQVCEKVLELNPKEQSALTNKEIAVKGLKGYDLLENGWINKNNEGLIRGIAIGTAVFVLVINRVPGIINGIEIGLIVILISIVALISNLATSFYYGKLNAHGEKTFWNVVFHMLVIGIIPGVIAFIVGKSIEKNKINEYQQTHTKKF